MGLRQPLTTYKPLDTATAFKPASGISAPALPAPAAPPKVITDQDVAPVGTNPQFEVLRKQAVERSAAAAQGQQDVLNRRLARLGNLNSGAALKQSQNLENSLNQQKEEAMGNIDVAEAADTAQRRQQALSQRIQQEQFNQTFGEQQKQNQFTNSLALDEHQLNKFMTQYNAALSLGTTEGKNNIQAAFQQLFPDQQMSFDQNQTPAGSTGGAIARAANSRNLNDWHDVYDEFHLNNKSFGGSAIYADREYQKFRNKARNKGYSDAAIKQAAKRAGF
jgi:hypothetical protein